MSTDKQKTRTRELYSREHPNDDGSYTSGGGPDGGSLKVHGRRTWLKLIAWDDLEYFSARAIVDPRPREALLVQEGLFDNHPFIMVF